MQRKLTFLLRSEEEEVKDAGLTLDFDEMARKGVMSKEEKTVAKWYGVYSSRQPGNHMARVVIPGGQLTSAQARNIADISEKYGQGILNLTTRTAIQFHWLKIGNLADMMRGLAEEGSTTMHGCGDVTRPVATCPLAETCPHARINVLPWAQKLQKLQGDAEDLDNLPRKFKISLSGCSAGCGQPYINCVGLVAVERNDRGATEKGFRVIAGGGLGWTPFLGQELFSFIPEHRVTEVARAITLTYRDHGDRYDRSTSRLKFVVQREGIEQVRAWVLGHLEAEGKSVEGLETAPFAEAGAPIPDRPLAELGDTPEANGTAVVRMLVPRGELTHAQFRKIAELSEVYGNQKVTLINRQNVQLTGVAPAQVLALKDEIRQLGLGTEGFFGIRDIVPCVGTTYCPKAVTETRSLHDLLLPVVTRDKYRPVDNKVVINITGCPNSCSPYRIADIGFRGLRIRLPDVGSVEGYELLLGGDRKAFGVKLGDFKKEDCPDVVETVLDTFLKVRSGDETLARTVARTGLEPFRQAVFP